MRIVIATPAPPASRHGNRTTASRWARILRGLGHRVAVQREWTGQDCDVLLALHARRSFASIRRFHSGHPGRPLIVALTGTDLYRDLPRHRGARQALEWAWRLIVLHPRAPEALPAAARRKAVVITQSLDRREATPSVRRFDVCVLAHLRQIKDPFRAAMASRLLPAASRVRILQVGGAMTRAMGSRARQEERRNPRYRWLGNLPRWRALQVLGRCRLLVLSSRAEGGANAVSEALACGVPVLASRIPGNMGLLGKRYPGTFGVGDTRGLAALLTRAEAETAFLDRLRAACASRRALIEPAREQSAWRRLLASLPRAVHR